VLGGSLDIGLCGDLGSRLRFDRLSYGQDAIARRCVIETGQIRQELIQDLGGLLIGKFTAELHL